MKGTVGARGDDANMCATARSLYSRTQIDASYGNHPQDFSFASLISVSALGALARSAFVRFVDFDSRLDS